jgi:hypothetical protein
MGDETETDVEPDEADDDVASEAGLELGFAGAVARQRGDHVITLRAKHDSEARIDGVDTVRE